jgi:TRAP-type C4-dicarboxylate transport system permease small subunit
MSSLRTGVRTTLDRASAGAMILAAASLFFMSVIQAWQVFARYVLNDSPGWTEPVALLLMSFTVMLGASVAVRREAHFAFQTLLHALSPMRQMVLKTISRLIAAASGFALMVLGGRLMIDDWSVSMAGAPLPSGLKFAALCVGGALILIFSLERLAFGDFQAEGEG